MLLPPLLGKDRVRREGKTSKASWGMTTLAVPRKCRERGGALLLSAGGEGERRGESRRQTLARPARSTPQETCPSVPPRFTTSWGLRV